MLGEEFDSLIGKFFVRSPEVGKFWEAYNRAKQLGYSGNRLVAYVGAAIKNYRRDLFKEKMRNLSHFEGEVHYHDSGNRWRSTSESGYEDLIYQITDQENLIILQERIEKFKVLYREYVPLLERWVLGEHLTRREYNILIRAFTSLGED